MSRSEPGLRGRRRASSRDAEGFSLIEVMIAAFIMLAVLIGLVPIFARSLASNLSGEESTQASVHGRSALDENLQLAFNNWQLEINAGTERTSARYWTQGEPNKIGDEGWVGTPAEVKPTDKWLRALTIRQFQMTGVDDADGDGVIEVIFGLEDDDGDGYFDNPLPAGTSRQAVHLKEIDVRVTNARAPGVLGVPSKLGLRLLKSF